MKRIPQVGERVFWYTSDGARDEGVVYIIDGDRVQLEGRTLWVHHRRFQGTIKATPVKVNLIKTARVTWRKSLLDGVVYPTTRAGQMDWNALVGKETKIIIKEVK